MVINKSNKIRFVKFAVDFYMGTVHDITLPGLIRVWFFKFTTVFRWSTIFHKISLVKKTIHS